MNLEIIFFKIQKFIHIGFYTIEGKFDYEYNPGFVDHILPPPINCTFVFPFGEDVPTTTTTTTIAPITTTIAPSTKTNITMTLPPEQPPKPPGTC